MRGSLGVSLWRVRLHPAWLLRSTQVVSRTVHLKGGDWSSYPLAPVTPLAEGWPGGVSSPVLSACVCSGVQQASLVLDRTPRQKITHPRGVLEGARCPHRESLSFPELCTAVAAGS